MYAGTSQNCCRTPCKACLQYTVMFQLKLLNLNAESSRSEAAARNVPTWVLSAAAPVVCQATDMLWKVLNAAFFPFYASQSFETVIKSA